MIIQTYEEITGSGWTVVAFLQPRRVHDVVAMKEWCRSVYGEPGTRWLDSVEYGEIRFENPKDVTLFLLKYSS